MNQKVKFSTLGCRLNQYETQAMREQFQKAGFEETESSSEANVFVLNTCTVTNDSDRTSRYLIRKFHRENPDAQIVVTGCYVEKNEAEIKNIPGVSLTVLNRQKSEMIRLLESCASFDLPSKRTYTPLSITQFEGHRRAYVKIQDGCNHACSFCKVVLVRGASRSRFMDDVIDEARRLTDNGYREIVLTGIQLGAYGYDLKKHQMLPELLERLCQVPGMGRIRLSSIEPTDVTDELIEAMTSFEQICPHLHIPLQSGSDVILERMNRRYRRDFYGDLIRRIKSRVPDFILTADVMIGFPGEGDLEFEETVQILEESEPYKLHIFPYSPREGTRAAKFQDAPDAQTVKQRREALLVLEEKWKENIQRQYVGRTVKVLIEETSDAPGHISGRTANYIQVYAPFEFKEAAGTFQEIDIQEIQDSRLVGHLVHSLEREVVS
jgi:threonylcarbamoyladenosine tRNA methylthiotransferase MtaB